MYTNVTVTQAIADLMSEIMLAQLGNHRGYKFDAERILGQWACKLQDISDTLEEAQSSNSW